MVSRIFVYIVFFEEKHWIIRNMIKLSKLLMLIFLISLGCAKPPDHRESLNIDSWPTEAISAYARAIEEMIGEKHND